MATLAGDTRCHVGEVGTGSDGGGVAFEALRDDGARLGDAECLLRCLGWRTGMTELASGVTGLAIPGEPVFEVDAIVAEDRGYGLHSGDE